MWSICSSVASLKLASQAHSCFVTRRFQEAPWTLMLQVESSGPFCLLRRVIPRLHAGFPPLHSNSAVAMKGYHAAAARCAPQSSTSEAPRPPTRVPDPYLAVDEMHRARLPLERGHSLVWRPALLRHATARKYRSYSSIRLKLKKV